jgi:hypothetical protein
MLKRQNIAEEIYRDLTCEEEPACSNTLEEGKPTKCFCCGASYIYRRPTYEERAGRFCGKGCQDNYDRGIVRDAPSIRYKFADGRPMRRTDGGFTIKCHFCSQPFASTGLRCCSHECERALKDRFEALEVAAQIGHTPRPHRVCEGCGGRVPRHARASQRFCSSRCQQKSARKAKQLLAPT